jgi:prophage regulatory protein
MAIRARPIVPTSAATSGRPATLQYLRAAEVCALLRISRPTLWRLRRDREFPAPTALSRRSIGWRQSDVEQWLNERTPDDPRPSLRKPPARLVPPVAPSRADRPADTTTGAPAASRKSARPRRASQLDMTFEGDSAG